MRFAILAGFVLSIAAVGCSTGDGTMTSDTGKFVGTVKYKRSDGKTVIVTGGQLMLVNAEDAVQQIPVTIRADGKFYGYQLSPGNYKVVVDTEIVRQQEPSPEEKNPPKYMPVPFKYRSHESTPIAVTIEAGKELKKDLVLTN